MENYASILKEKGFVIANIYGTSMYPMLRQGIDTVHIVKINDKLKRNDVILFQRDNGKYVLHRLLKFKNGKYVFCGDNQFKKDYTIKDHNLIGIMDGFYRKEKYILKNNFWYKVYYHLVPIFRPFVFIKYCFKKIFTKKGK